MAAVIDGDGENVQIILTPPPPPWTLVDSIVNYSFCLEKKTSQGFQEHYLVEYECEVEYVSFIKERAATSQDKLYLPSVVFGNIN